MGYHYSWGHAVSNLLFVFEWGCITNYGITPKAPELVIFPMLSEQPLHFARRCTMAHGVKQ